MEEWEPIDWRGEDGTNFFKGCLIGLCLAAPFWVWAAWLLGWF